MFYNIEEVAQTGLIVIGLVYAISNPSSPVSNFNFKLAVHLRTSGASKNRDCCLFFLLFHCDYSENNYIFLVSELFLVPWGFWRFLWRFFLMNFLTNSLTNSLTNFLMNSLTNSLKNFWQTFKLILIFQKIFFSCNLFVSFIIHRSTLDLVFVQYFRILVTWKNSSVNSTKQA